MNNTLKWLLVIVAVPAIFYYGFVYLVSHFMTSPIWSESYEASDETHTGGHYFLEYPDICLLPV